MNHQIRIHKGPGDQTDDIEPEYDFAAIRAEAQYQGSEYRGILSGTLIRLEPEFSANGSVTSELEAFIAEIAR